MIYLSASLPKSASTLLYTYTEQMLYATGKRNGQIALRKLVAAGRLKGVDTFLEKFGAKETFFLLWLQLRYGNVLIKTHTAPNFWVRQLIRLGLVRATYIYRDPRDVLLSSMDHAIRTKEGDLPRFQQYLELQPALAHLKRMLQKAVWWKQFGRAHFLTYVDILTTPNRSIRQICQYLNWDLSDEQLDRIIEDETAKRGYGQRQFNTGKVRRYKEEMSEDLQAQFLARFEGEMNILGFSTEHTSTTQSSI